MTRYSEYAAMIITFVNHATLRRALLSCVLLASVAIVMRHSIVHYGLIGGMFMSVLTAGWVLAVSLLVLGRRSALIVIVLCLAVSVVYVASGRDQTMIIMGGIKRRILNKTAFGLMNRPELERFCVVLQRQYGAMDAWGRTIEWSFVDRMVTLTSLGADGRPGGNGDDADIVYSFAIPSGGNAEHTGSKRR